MDMTEVERRSLYDHALKVYGEEAQIKMLCEECSELIQAGLKKIRNTSDTLKWESNFLEELVDVSIMLEQFMLLVDDNLEDRFKRIKDHKLNKLKRFLNLENYKFEKYAIEENDWLE